MKDPRQEQFLDRGQWAWEYHEKVDFSEIDLKTSEENPARLNRKLDDLRAQQYGCDMLDGYEFPAIMLLNHENLDSGFKYIVASGMHRISGAKDIGRTSFDAYIVSEADHYRREVVIRQSNKPEGRGMTIGEQIEHVLWLKRKYPDKSITELAKSWGIKASTLQAAWNEDQARDRARSMGYDFERIRLPQKSTLALGTIHSDVVFRKAAEFVNDVGGTNAGELRDMADSIKKARDEKTQLEIVQKTRDGAEARLKRSAAKTARTQPTRVNRLIADCRRTNKHFDRPLDELYVGALDGRGRSDAVEITQDLIENLKRFIHEVERVQEMSRPEARPGTRPEMRI